MSTIKATCQNWGLVQIHGRKADAPGAIGQVVRWGTRGQTTAIVSIDPINHTVTTATGSVYALGIPNLMFLVKNPKIMRELGF